FYCILVGFLFLFPPCAPTALPTSFPTRRSSDLPALRSAFRGQQLQQAPLVAVLQQPQSAFRPLLDRADALAHREAFGLARTVAIDRKSTRLNSSHVKISYAGFCLKKKKNTKPVA